MRTLCFIAPLFVCLAAIAMPLEQAQTTVSAGALLFGELSLPMQLVVMTGLGASGMLTHYVKKWATGDIAGSLWNYLVTDNPRRSLLAVMGVAGAMATAYFAGQFDGLALKQVLMPGWLIGYAFDSALNKGANPDMTPSSGH